mmetsp:Transcript_25579/g.55255  ORF Transcript_25579/g.55255 Transcript_25579/m.55255 type:complete len:119 (-) Transcript_25579:149-505(-)
MLPFLFLLLDPSTRDIRSMRKDDEDSARSSKDNDAPSEEYPLDDAYPLLSLLPGGRRMGLPALLSLRVFILLSISNWNLCIVYRVVYVVIQILILKRRYVFMCSLVYLSIQIQQQSLL